MNAELRPELCIIGGGPGGVSLALGAAAQGLSVVLAEKSALGGRKLAETLPFHALLAIARQAGAKGEACKPDFARVQRHAAQLAKAIGPDFAPERLAAMNVTVLQGAARFTSPETCEVSGRAIRARRFVVATGAEERRPAIPGLELVRPVHCAALCAMGLPPPHLIIVGPCFHGLALAQAMRRFGSGVTVLAEGELFAGEDPELVQPVRAAFAREGLAVHENVRIARIEPAGDGIKVFLGAGGREKFVKGSHLYLAAESSPAIAGLGLEAARVRYNDRGIETDAHLATSNPRIYAIGAAVSGTQPASGAAGHHAALVLRTVLGLPGGQRHRHGEPRVIPAIPPIAVTGLSETEAKAACREILVLRWPFAETERARIENELPGHVKLITDRAGKILGAGAVGQRAEELISLLSLAIWKNMTVSEIGSIMIPYPALAEAAQKAAGTVLDVKPDAQPGAWRRAAGTGLPGLLLTRARRFRERLRSWLRRIMGP